MPPKARPIKTPPPSTICAVCQKDYKTVLDLATHTRNRHTMIRCGYLIHPDVAGVFCEEVIEGNHQLTQHKKLHDWPRIHECRWNERDGQPPCNKMFHSIGYLEKHEEQHEGPLLHCSLVQEDNGCVFSCVLPSDLRDHKKNHVVVKLDDLAVSLSNANISYEGPRKHYVSFKGAGHSKRGAFVDYYIKLADDYHVFLEKDENQRRSDSVTEDPGRMMDVFDAADENMKCIFIRFNPGKYKANGIKAVGSNNVDQLICLLTSKDSPVYSGKPRAILYMFYDTDAHGKLVIHSKTGYDQEIANLCLPCIC